MNITESVNSPWDPSDDKGLVDMRSMLVVNHPSSDNSDLRAISTNPNSSYLQTMRTYLDCPKHRHCFHPTSRYFVGTRQPWGIVPVREECR